MSRGISAWLGSGHAGEGEATQRAILDLGFDDDEMRLADIDAALARGDRLFDRFRRRQLWNEQGAADQHGQARHAIGVDLEQLFAGEEGVERFAGRKRRAMRPRALVRGLVHQPGRHPTLLSSLLRVSLWLPG